MKFEDLYRPAALLGLAGATAVLGLAAGVAILRDPALARRLLSTGVRGLERARLAAAETVEEAIDLWEDVRAQARREVEDERFAEAQGASASGETGGRAWPPAASPKRAAKKPRTPRSPGAPRTPST
jgi:hypothetical protein